MNFIVTQLPSVELFLKKGFVELKSGSSTLIVDINHVMKVHNFYIFFGTCQGKYVHGYLDYDNNTGGLSEDE